MDEDTDNLDDCMRRAEEILTFIRRSSLVVAIDNGVWLLLGNSVGQLAGFLYDQDERHGLLRHQTTLPPAP